MKPGNNDVVGTENLLTNVPLFFLVFQILDVKNVLVVVTRWFGGILLGGELLCTSQMQTEHCIGPTTFVGDRFKHINNAARDVLELGHFLDASGKSNSPASGGGDAAKKKNRKGK
jgi:Uncharacterized protein family UPF0029